MRLMRLHCVMVDKAALVKRQDVCFVRAISQCGLAANTSRENLTFHYISLHTGERPHVQTDRGIS